MEWTTGTNKVHIYIDRTRYHLQELLVLHSHLDDTAHNKPGVLVPTLLASASPSAVLYPAPASSAPACHVALHGPLGPERSPPASPARPRWRLDDVRAAARHPPSIIHLYPGLGVYVSHIPTTLVPRACVSLASPVSHPPHHFFPWLPVVSKHPTKTFLVVLPGRCSGSPHFLGPRRRYLILASMMSTCWPPPSPRAPHSPARPTPT